MTEQFQKAFFRHSHARAKKEYEKEAINNLRTVIDEANEETFFDNFINHLDKTLQPKSKTSPEEDEKVPSFGIVQSRK